LHPDVERISEAKIAKRHSKPILRRPLLLPFFRMVDFIDMLFFQIGRFDR